MNWIITYNEDRTFTIDPSPFNPHNGDIVKYIYPESLGMSIKELTTIWDNSWDNLPYSTSQGTFKLDILDFSKTEQ